MPDDVQPVEGQGTEGSGGLFDSYLQAVPQDQRSTVESYLKDADKNVKARLEEAAQIKRQWEPYQGVEALKQYQPEELSQLLEWHQQVASNEDIYKQWLTEQAQEAGLSLAEAQELADEPQGELTREEVQQLIQQQAGQLTQPLQQELEELRQERQVDAEVEVINSTFKDLESKNNLSLSPEDRELILDLGEKYEGEGNWIEHGFERFQKITSAGQRAFVEGKMAQPDTPLSTGGMERFQAPKTFKEAADQARERLRQSQS